MSPEPQTDPRLTDPTPPSTTYLEATARLVRERMAGVSADHGDAADYDGQPELWDRAADGMAELEEELTALLQALHADPETAFEEHRSQQRVAAVLERHGFAVQRGVHEVPTSLRAEWRAEGFDPTVHPTIAVLAEYDALPGVGHACGHNIIAAAAVGAFCAGVDTLAGRADLPARLVFLGTPAEEGHTGKEYMIRGGMLEGIDAAVMIHPFSFDIASHMWVGRRTLSVTYEGVAAHASSQPFMGRNALDAAVLAYQGFGLLRQQMPPSDRLHAVIPEGGHRPSVIPQTAHMQVYLRSALVDSLVDLSVRVDEVLDGAALMAGVTVHKEWDDHPMSLPIRNNRAMADRWARTQSARGRLALPAGIVPDTLAASTDFGNVSFLVPGIHPMVKIAPEGVALHTEEFARWAAGPEASRAAVDAAVGLAQVIVDLVADPRLLDEAKAEFAADGGPRAVDDLLDAARRRE